MDTKETKFNINEGLDQLQEAVFTWVLQATRIQYQELDRHRVSLMGMKFNEALQIFKFFNRSKFVSDFEERYGNMKKYNDFKKPPGLSPTTYFSPVFCMYVKNANLSPGQVYTADEDSLYWRFTKNSQGKSISETLDENRITFLCCTNTTGQHKLNPLIVGRYKDPKSLANTEIPVHYYSQRKAWMTRRLFQKWFFQCFVPEVRLWLREQGLPERALLLIDSASCHPPVDLLKTDDESIIAVFLRPDGKDNKGQNVFSHVKKHYKENFLRMATSETSDADLISKFNLRDMAYLLADSWNSVPTSAIRSWWEYMKYDARGWISAIELAPSGEDCEPLLDKLSKKLEVTMDDLMLWYDGVDEDENGSHFLSEEEIVNNAMIMDLEGFDEQEIEGSLSVSKDSTPSEAKQHFDRSIQWAEENGYSCSYIAMLRHMRDKVLRMGEMFDVIKTEEYIIDEEEELLAVSAENEHLPHFSLGEIKSEDEDDD